MIIQIKDTTYNNNIYVVSNVSNSLVSDKEQYAKFENCMPEINKSYTATPVCFWDSLSNNNNVIIHFVCKERRALDDTYYS